MDAAQIIEAQYSVLIKAMQKHLYKEDAEKIALPEYIKDRGLVIPSDYLFYTTEQMELLYKELWRNPSYKQRRAWLKMEMDARKKIRAGDLTTMVKLRTHLNNLMLSREIV